MKVPKSVSDLIEVFEMLPGIGPKTAARLVYYLLHAPESVSQRLSESAGDLKKDFNMAYVVLSRAIRAIWNASPFRITSF